MNPSTTSNSGLPAWACIVLWITLGTSMIMFNKMLLTTWGFRYPCFLTAWHCVLSSALTQVLARTTNLLPSVEKGVVTKRDFFVRIMPMAVCFAFGLVVGNMAYAYISLAYIQMIKAFTPVPLLLLSFVAGLEKPSLALFGIVLVISAGVTLSSVGELEFSTVGFLLQLSAVLVDCFRMIIMNLMLKDMSLDSLSLLYYTAPPSAVLIAAAFFALEAHSMQWALFTPALCVALLANGLLAFSLNVAVIYLVSNTSAVVMSVSGPLKDILIVLISVLVFRAPITALQIGGFAVSLAGLYMYREYKSDPKRAVELCLGALPCILCFGGDNNNTSNTEGGAPDAKQQQSAGGRAVARSPRGQPSSSSAQQQLQRRGEDGVPRAHSGEDAECELPLLGAATAAVSDEQTVEAV